jgi:endonuclease/exonuclease/phosphatase (EEP) superfamily protein YafD
VFFLLGSVLTGLSVEVWALDPCGECVARLWDISFPREIFPIYRLTQDSEGLIRYGKANQQRLSTQNISILVWNVHKSVDPRWLNDFLKFSKANDLLILQEFVYEPKTELPLSYVPDEAWRMAAGFFSPRGVATGVATGSKSNPVSERFIRSQTREPIAGTPKMALVTDYALKDLKTRLRVVNVHGINFTKSGNFRMQLNQLEESLEEHTGPMILAGDFNTWSPERTQALKRLASQVGLQSAQPVNESRLLVLDYFFYRGLKVSKTEILNDVVSSDHKPLRVFVDSIHGKNH